MTNQIGLVILAHHQHSFDLSAVLMKVVDQVLTRAVDTDQQTIGLLLIEHRV